MMGLSVFKTVRGRLLALLVAITLPIACLTAAAAVSTYRTVIGAIQTAQVRVADDFGVRTRVWYRGTLRSLLATSGAISAMPSQESDCSAVTSTVLQSVPGYLAMQITMPGRPKCTASVAGAPGEGDLARIQRELFALPSAPVAAGSELADAHYGQVELDGKRYLAIAARHPVAGGTSEAMLLAGTDLLRNVFNLGAADPHGLMALVQRGGNVLLTRGGSAADTGWLPKSELIPAETQRWDAPSREGRSRAYAATLVAAPDLYVIASFDETAQNAARTQFLALLAAPLLTLALLCIFYLRAIDMHCVRWLRVIEGAARARATQSKARAPVSDDMPRDIRSVADAFNTMVDEQEVRQRKLQLAIEDNRYLVRELHHRVKNSLQVVQSYLGLTKRDHQGEARLALSDAECRVHVLSAAYRFTLADGEMQPVRIDLFLEDVVSVVSSLIRKGEQSVTGRVATAASLPIDRIIPLGFLIVDVVSRALRSAPAVSVTITVADVDANTIKVAIEADRPIEMVAPPRIFAGLLAQVEAIELSSDQQGLGVWHLRHGD